MSERDELAKAVFVADNYNANDDVTLSDWEALVASDGDGSYAHRIAQGLIQAGFRKPRIIATAEELDALPVQSVIRDAEDYVWERFGSGPASWDCAGVPDWESHLIALPATVLWEPR